MTARRPCSAARTRHALSAHLAAAFVAFLCLPAAAQDWTQWRGPGRDGLVPAANAPVSWPESLRRAWWVEVGEGYSSPVVAGGRAFVHSRRDPQEVVTALDLADGRVLWRQEYPAPFHKNQYATERAKGPHSTPLALDGRLFTLGGTGVLTAWDAASGRRLWGKDFSGEVDTSKLFCGTAASPLAAGGKVVIQVGSDVHGGRIVALDPATGQESWEWRGPGPGYASPVVIDVAGTPQLVTMTEGSVVGLDPATGRELWSAPFPDEWHENIATPVWTGSLLVVSGTRQGTHAFALERSGGAWKAVPRWTNPDVAMYMSSPVAGDGLLYGHSAKRKGQFVALDAETGALRWATEGREGDHASVLLTPRNLVLLNNTGDLLVARRGTTAFEAERRYDVADTETWAMPALLGERLLVRDAAGIMLLAPEATASQSWIERSNESSRLLLDAQARFAPESSGAFGVEGLDEEVLSLPLDRDDQITRALQTVLAELEKRRAAEREPAVAQDLDILITETKEGLEDIDLSRRHFLPVIDLSQTVFQGLRGLLDDRVPKERYPAALVRLGKYAGMAPGTTPLATQATARLRGGLAEPGLLPPFRGDLERQLNNSSRFLDGIGELFRKFGLEGWEEPLAKVREQVAGYEAVLRAEVLPRARDDFRLPPEVYRFRLRQRGIDMPLEELVSRAKTSFREVQNEMQTLAVLVARERDLPSTDYRDVIRALKKQQLVGEAILPHYQQRIRDLERLIREHHVVTLPDRPARVRLASAAESAAVPAPNLSPPRLIGNTGETADFVLPLRIPGEGGAGDAGFDDFTFEAASWTLTAHEARPGHELQFSKMMETEIPLARAFFAFNSVNVEGWALYAEAEMKPLLPLDGQLIALQHRLLRAARAFLDPGLQTGAITREEAFRVLEEDVVTSHAMATQEVERYTFRSPGQAPSYYVGYCRLLELRTDAERLLGDRFDRQRYHDFLLTQGMLSPVMLRKAVVEQFVPAEIEKAASEAKPMTQ